MEQEKQQDEQIKIKVPLPNKVSLKAERIKGTHWKTYWVATRSLKFLLNIRHKLREKLIEGHFSRLYESNNGIGQPYVGRFFFTCWSFRKIVDKFDFGSCLSKILAESTCQEIEGETLLFMIPKSSDCKERGFIFFPKEIDSSDNFQEFQKKLELIKLQIEKQIKTKHNENGSNNNYLDNVLEDSFSYLNDFWIFTKNSQLLSREIVNFEPSIHNPGICMANALGLKFSSLNELFESNASYENENEKNEKKTKEKKNSSKSQTQPQPQPKLNKKKRTSTRNVSKNVGKDEVEAELEVQVQAHAQAHAQAQAQVQEWNKIHSDVSQTLKEGETEIEIDVKEVEEKIQKFLIKALDAVGPEWLEKLELQMKECKTPRVDLIMKLIMKTYNARKAPQSANPVSETLNSEEILFENMRMFDLNFYAQMMKFTGKLQSPSKNKEKKKKSRHPKPSLSQIETRSKKTKLNIDHVNVNVF